jgi:MoaE-MoaD fusion protein
VIRVRVRLFAMQRELAGARELPLELEDGATIEDAWLAVVARHPLLAPGRPSVRFARNADYAPASTALEDGDEVAMIPPVSGGAPDGDPIAGGSLRILELREAPFDASILAELAERLASPADGAVVGFLGVTRSSPGTPAPGQEAEAARHLDQHVHALEYEAHPAMTIRILEAIADEILERFEVGRLAIVHRTGTVPLGEPSVAIVATAPHRDSAFAAARYAIDETKARAPIWKAEQFADGTVWIGEPARDSPRSEATPREPSARGFGEPARDSPRSEATPREPLARGFGEPARDSPRSDETSAG